MIQEPTVHAGLEDIFPDISEYPTVNLQVGQTHYLDSVRATDISDSNGDLKGFAKGVDKFGRPFVCANIQIDILEEGSWRLCEKSIYTVFQRYTDSPVLVICLSHHDHQRGIHLPAILRSSTLLGTESTRILKAIVQSNRKQSPYLVKMIPAYSVGNSVVSYRCWVGHCSVVSPNAS